MQEKMGIIHPKDTLFLRQAIGSATLNGIKYDLDMTVSGFPLIRSEKTGKWFSVSWEALIKQAIDEGINEEESKNV